jgi:hypothetical protein
MSKLIRQLIVSEVYEGRTLEARYMGPDLLGFVKPVTGETIELAGFFIDARAAIEGGKRYVDAEIKAVRERAEKAARAQQ